MVERFSKDEPNPQEIMQRFAEWLSDAKTWYESNKQRIPVWRDDLARQREARNQDPELKQRKERRAQAWKRYHEEVNELTS